MSDLSSAVVPPVSPQAERQFLQSDITIPQQTNLDFANSSVSGVECMLNSSQGGRMTTTSYNYVLGQLKMVCKAITELHPSLPHRNEFPSGDPNYSNTPRGTESLRPNTDTSFCGATDGVQPLSSRPILGNVQAIERILSRRYKPPSESETASGSFFDVVSMEVASKFASKCHDILLPSPLAKLANNVDVSPSSASTQVVDHWDVLSSCTPPSNAASPSRNVLATVVANNRIPGPTGNNFASDRRALHNRQRPQKDVKLAPEVFLPPAVGLGIDNVFSGGFGGVCDVGDPLRTAQRSGRRRHSADCEQLRAELERRVRTARRSHRRRKSMDDSTLAMAALHAHQMQGLREFQSPHSALSGVGRGILRSQSTLCVTERLADGGTQSGQRDRVGKQKSLIPISPSTINDSWPASITSMLTCGQSISDRLFVFCQIEKLLTQFSRNPSDSIDAAGLCKYGYAQTEAGSTLSSASTAESMPQTRKTSIFQMSGFNYSTSIGEANAIPAPQQPNDCLFPMRRTSALRILSGAWTIPRPDKKQKGEDAYFLADWADGFIGVADGVGEWCELGSNPRKFADELMQGAKRAAGRQFLRARKLTSQMKSVSCDTQRQLPNCNNHLTGEEANDRASVRAMKILQEGYNSTKSFGSSTVLIAGLDHEGKTLGLANLGDSALIVFRRESRRHRHFTVCRRTKEQQHFFNCPYQLSRVPTEEDVPELQRKGMHRLVRVLHNLQSNYEGDTPDMADLYDIKLQEGDLIIAATDGLLDNLFDREVASLVSLCLSPYEASILSRAGLHNEADCNSFPHPDSVILPDYHKEFGFATPPINVARAVAEAAFYRSMDPTVKTPFAVQSRRAGGFFSGGKMDDITVVAMWVV